MRVLIVDDHDIVRRGIRSLLLAESGMDICGEAVDGNDAISKSRELQPDVVIMDISMPGLNGLEATRAIRSMLPQIEILILSQHDTPEMIRQALKAGASGYVLKSAISTDLLTAVRKVRTGAPSSEASILALQEKPETMDAQEILQRSIAFEKALRESEERLRQALHYNLAVMNNLAEGLYTVDNQGLLSSINPAAETMFGWTKEELLGKKMHDVVHYKRLDGSPFPASECQGFKVRRTGRPIRELEDVFIRKDGSFMPVVLSASPLIKDGQTSGVVVSFRDDTEQRRARQAMRESEERVRLALDAGKLGAWEWDIQHNHVTWSDRIYEFHGLEPGSFAGTLEAFAKLVHPEDLPMVRRALDNSLTRRAPYELEFRTIRPNGEVRWLFTRAAVSRDSAGAPLRLVGITHDVTERKHIELAFADGARRQKALFQLADQLHRAKSLDSVHEAAFDAILSALRCDRASILLFDNSGVMRFVSWRGLSDAYRRAVEGHSPWKPDETGATPICMENLDTGELDSALRNTIESEGIAALAFVPLISHDRVIGKFMIYYNAPHAFTQDEMDLSLTIAHQLAFGIERIQREQALRENEARLRALSEALEREVRARTQELELRSTEVSQQSQQLRNLSARLLTAQDEERRRIARELHDGVGQLLAVIAMNLGAVSSEKHKLSPSLALSLAETSDLVEQVLTDTRTISHLLHPPLLDEVGLHSALRWYLDGFAQRSKINVTLDLPTDLGRLPRDSELVLFRIVQEALTNIHRHSGSSTASVRLCRKPDYVTLEIVDQGKGISPEIQVKLSSGETPGVGLRGMRERVRQLDGTLDVHSTPDGTSIIVVLPLAHDSADSSPEDPQPIPQRAAATKSVIALRRSV